MGLELVVIGLGLLAVAITRGSYKKLFATKFSYVWVLGLVIIGSLAVTFFPFDSSQYDTVGLGILLATYVLLFGFCITNLDKFGMLFVLAGTVCNALVIGLNKGMPISDYADFSVNETIRHQGSSANDFLPWLGGIIPINVLSFAISVGDILLAIGVVTVCISCSRRAKSTVAADNEQIEQMEEQFESEIDENVESALDEIVSSIGPTTDEVPIVSIEDHHSATATIVDEDDEEIVVIDLTHEEQVAMLEESSQVQEEPKKKAYKGTKRQAKRRSSRRWQKTHGLGALPSKEELGYDDVSMEIVDAAE